MIENKFRQITILALGNCFCNSITVIPVLVGFPPPDDEPVHKFLALWHSSKTKEMKENIINEFIQKIREIKIHFSIRTYLWPRQSLRHTSVQVESDESCIFLQIVIPQSELNK